MLNRVILMGRITHDLELKQTPSGISALSFPVAVDRDYSKNGAEKQTDFINCVAWRQTAEFIGKYFGKGRMIALEGQLRTRTYDDKNGTKHYVTEVYVDKASFTGEPKQGGNFNQNNNGVYQQSAPAQNNSNYNNAPANDAMSIGDLADFEEVLSDGEVPF